MATAKARLLGLLLVVLGVWGGIVAYAGPAFGYRMDTAPAWDWTQARWQLHAVAGGAVVLGGLLLLAAAPRLIARLGAFLAVLGGMWLVVGPLFASTWLGAGAETQLASASLSQAMRPLGYHYGTGVLIVGVAAYTWAMCRVYAHEVPYPGRGRRDSILEDTTLSTMLGGSE